MNEIDTLREVILELHGCSSRHVSTVPVKETSQGHTVWQGLIEVFDLIDHPKADRCYAWTYQDDEGRIQYAAVLGLPPVQSAHDAVKAEIADPPSYARAYCFVFAEPSRRGIRQGGFWS